MPQDYSGQNLRGRSFQGQDLTGANFSGADIRSTDFTGANLIGANFTDTKAGLQRRWATFLVVVSLILTGVSGFLSAFAGGLVACLIFNTTKNHQISNLTYGVTIVVIVGIFFFFTIRQGILGGLRAFAVTVAVVISVVFMIMFVVIVTVLVTTDKLVHLNGAGLGFFAFSAAELFVFFVALVVAVAFIFTVAIAFAVAIAGSLTIAGVGSFVIAVPFAIIFAFTGAKTFALIVRFARAGAFTGTVAVVFAIAIVLFGMYISWRALKGDTKHALIYNIAIAFAAFKGTSFRNTNLTDANFAEATLKSTDFRKANIIRTCWRNAKKLDRIRPGTTYLQNEQAQQLVITGEGKNTNFNRLDLRGLNLQEADLENASFIDTDFYQANLQGANLSRTILVRTNFERADLRGTNLTGSCIQDWVITESTKLDGIICDYIYLKWVDGDKRDQMPPRGQFKEGGFVTFVKYILETVELYHEKDINPRLALTILQKMARDYDEPFDLVALGKRGEKVFIQVKVSENVIRENFKEDYYSRYDTDLKLWSGNIHRLPPAVNSFIENRISEIVSQRTDDFVFIDANYVEGNYTEISQGEVNMSGDRTIHMGDGNYNERIQGNYVQGNYYAAGQQSLADAAAEIQNLLEQLDKSYPTDTTAGKMAIATQAIQYIDSNQILAQRVLGALKAGGTQALAQLLNHPAASFVIGALDDWQKSKGS